MENKHCILGDDFDVMKRNPVENIFGNQKVKILKKNLRN
jgi:hypothetical protein